MPYNPILRKALPCLALFLVMAVSAIAAPVPRDTDLVIRKADITATVTFYPYYSGRMYMEVMAVRASDGTVRTALNTCQVCYDSGRGYYRQEGGVVVCQNCGNRFRIDQIELIKGGCNPIPITPDLKTETADAVTIGKGILAQGAPFFRKWKKA